MRDSGTAFGQPVSYSWCESRVHVYIAAIYTSRIPPDASLWCAHVIIMAELCIERRTPRHLWPTVTATTTTTTTTPTMKNNDGIDVSMVHKNKANMPKKKRKTRSVCCENRVYFYWFDDSDKSWRETMHFDQSSMAGYSGMCTNV